ncbi:unnamed protein product [Rhizophagus irregularis]|nr:unnamed protein product [Rhizophagus irregularis]
MPNNHGTTSIGEQTKEQARIAKSSYIIIFYSSIFTSRSITPYSYAHSTDSFTSIHLSPSNYEYTSLFISCKFTLFVKNSLISHLPNGQEQQFATLSNNYTLNT